MSRRAEPPQARERHVSLIAPLPAALLLVLYGAIAALQRGLIGARREEAGDLIDQASSLTEPARVNLKALPSTRPAS